MSIRDELIELLDKPVHAPMSTHSGYDGSCSECPWPLYAMPLGDIADAIIAAFPWIAEDHEVEHDESEIFSATFGVPRRARFVTPWREVS